MLSNLSQIINFEEIWFYCLLTLSSFHLAASVAPTDSFWIISGSFSGLFIPLKKCFGDHSLSPSNNRVNSVALGDDDFSCGENRRRDRRSLSSRLSNSRRVGEDGHECLSAFVESWSLEKLSSPPAIENSGWVALPFPRLLFPEWKDEVLWSSLGLCLCSFGAAG